MVSLIFQDQAGFPIKFFIQKDLPQDVQTAISEIINALGGRVDIKVPRSGFILTETGSAEEGRLRETWFSPQERPERFFVPYTYVEACKDAEKLLPQIFLEHGHPIPMSIHPSIANPNTRNALNLRILHSGGNPHVTAQEARVILADPATDVFKGLIKAYQSEPNKYIESYLWVKKCVERGFVEYTPVVYKNPGGRRPGEERTPFTEDDEERLCQWIADKIPYKSTGGRTGNKLYQQLCAKVTEDHSYIWVERHTWQSWRERYKKNAARLDTRIAAIVDEKKPAQGEKGQYGYVRQPEEKPKRVRKKRKIDQVEEGDAPDGEGAPSHQQMMSHLGMHPVQTNMAQPVSGSSQQGPAPYPPLPLPSTSQLPDIGRASNQNGAGPSQLRQNATIREEDEESEWAIRIGNAPPPAWAQPAPVLGNVAAMGAKVANTGAATEATINERAQAELALVALANMQSDMHILDTGLAEIAGQTRFTFDEVKEYHNKCGDLQMTRTRFQKMRQMLQAHFGND